MHRNDGINWWGKAAAADPWVTIMQLPKLKFKGDLMRLMTILRLTTTAGALLSWGAGCGDDAMSIARLRRAAYDITVQALDTPSVTFDATRGTTTVVTKFIARKEDGTPIGPRDVDVDLLLDGAPLDSEAILQESAEAREVNLLYTMVLDATYSMLQHQPPAFEPMKQAAERSVKRGVALWHDRPGSFAWSLTWFDDYVYRPESTWPEAAIMSIPTPTQGMAFTRLFAALDYTLDDISRVRGASRPANAHNVLVVFSDGRDNHSAWNMPASASRVLREGDLSYRKIAWRATTLPEVLTKIRSRSDLTVHAIGLGDDVNDLELQAIADAGRGIYVKNPDAAGLDAVFARVTQEFTTIQTAGATIPNPPGDYELTVRLRPHDGTRAGEWRCRLHAGDANARAL